MANKGGKGARKLQDHHRAFLVQRIACYDSPKDAAAALKEQFGIEITPQGAEAYDPGKYAGRNMAKRWRELFDTTRDSFLKHMEQHIPEANKAVRVQRLALASRAFKARNNYVGMADMLERIAKELGNVHSNKRELTGKNGGAVGLDVAVSDMTDEQVTARLMELLGEILTGDSTKPA